MTGEPNRARFLFVFGYETPGQAKANAAHGCDDEDSAALFVEALSEEEALSWGQQVAAAFVRALFEGDTTHWSPDLFANWIERDPAAAYEPAVLNGLPVVRPGEFPDWNVLAGNAHTA